MSAQDRISQLEELVHSLMRSRRETATVDGSADIPLLGRQESPKRLPQEDPTGLVANLGRINLDDGGTSYVEGSHWTAILSGVSSLLYSAILSTNHNS